VVGVSRQTLNRGLRALETSGVVALGYASITILDPARRARLSGPEEAWAQAKSIHAKSFWIHLLIK
jgi:hypothetical protein